MVAIGERPFKNTKSPSVEELLMDVYGETHPSAGNEMLSDFYRKKST